MPYQVLGQIDHNLQYRIFDDVICKAPTGSQHTPLCLNFCYHSLGKTGQVLFLNACKITTIIQTKGNKCEGTRSGKGADAYVT